MAHFLMRRLVCVRCVRVCVCGVVCVCVCVRVHVCVYAYKHVCACMRSTDDFVDTHCQLVLSTALNFDCVSCAEHWTVLWQPFPKNCTLSISLMTFCFTGESEGGSEGE